MRKTSFALTAFVVLAAAAPAFAQNRGHEDPHSHGVRTHARYFAPPPRYHDRHHYYQGERWHGHPLLYRNGFWGYINPGGVFIRISF